MNEGVFSASEIAALTGGELYGKGTNVVTDLLTDSRSASFDSRVLFFAIQGKNHDGHNYIDDLVSRGIRSFVVERLPQKAGDNPDCSYIVVRDPVNALQRVAQAKRRAFSGEVIAVTGSAGKTIVKEWLADILNLERRVVRSPRSYNSQIGVPLSVWRLDNRFDAAVLEAGISLPGEMALLEPIIQPSTGIFTNIGDAHQENFSDLRSKVREKLMLFTGVNTLVYPFDCREIAEEIGEMNRTGPIELAGWSLHNPDAPFFAEVADSDSAGTTISITCRVGRIEYTIPFADRASVENSVSVATACIISGISQHSIATGMAALNPVAMRMSVRNGINNCLLIEDYYNSDPGSLAMAIDFLRTQQGRSHTLILSDFIQSGRNPGELAQITDTLLNMGMVTRFIGIGPVISANAGFFKGDAKFFASTNDFIAGFSQMKFANEAILLKGARMFGFERIASLLEQKSHTTVLEVNLDAVTSNLNQFRSRLNPGVKIMGMVKAFAYGSGISEMGSLLEFNRVDYLGVAYADEGVELREAGIRLPVMVMSPDEASYETLIRYNLEPELYSFRTLRGFSAVAARHGLSAWPVHLKIDTGMHRLGFLPDETGELADFLLNHQTLRVASVFSHLAASESSAMDSHTHRQAHLFETVCAEISRILGYMPVRHLLNSSGIVRFPQYQYEMVRPGIGLYGLTAIEGLALKQASGFVSRISQIKNVPAGEPVGYGYSDTSGTERRIATIPVGYADGLRRQMGNGKGYLWIAGRRVPVAGNVCMDMCMADVTGTGAEEGDPVEIFGENITIREVADICNTIPYEIITSIPPRVKRVFYHE
jgi:Alr-MurF fusion protein